MKKKLEAELISIAHRILKLKNRAELDQLQQETLKLYEKISVLRFVEDNFSDVKPTIGFASAEETLEKVYKLEEQPEVKANEVELEEAKAKAEKDSKKEEKETAKPEVKEEEEIAEPVAEVTEEPETEEEEQIDEAKEIVEDEIVEEPEAKIEIEKPEEELKAMEESAEAVFTKEAESTSEEEEKAADAEIVTITPDETVKVEDSGLSFDFAFDRVAASEEPVKQKEITFEDYQDYKEPEFVKKTDSGVTKPTSSTEEDKKEEAQPVVRDWRDWEPSQSGKTEVAEEPKKEEEPIQKTVQPEPVAEEPKKEVEKPKEESTVIGNRATRTDMDRPKALNDSLGKTISLTLNDRIAFEKQLFGGSGEDLNRVLSQLNTINTYEEAKNFIEDLVKPDYNDWAGKDEYAERFMGIVEKKFD